MGIAPYKKPWLYFIISKFTELRVTHEICNFRMATFPTSYLSVHTSSAAPNDMRPDLERVASPSLRAVSLGLLLHEKSVSRRLEIKHAKNGPRHHWESPARVVIRVILTLHHS